LGRALRRAVPWVVPLGRSALILRRFGTLLALAAICACAPANGAEGKDARIPGARETRIAEPVFGGEAVLYEAGVGHERSVVLVHGLGSNAARDYAGVLQWMSREFHVVTFDLPGFGGSSKQNAAYTPRSYVAFVNHVATNHVRRPFVLVGHSLGALVALRYAGTHPEDVQRLVVADVPGVLHRLSYASKLAAGGTAALLPGVPLPADRIEALARRLLGLVERAPIDLAAALEDPEQRMFYFEGLPERIAGVAVAAEDPREWLPRVVAPTLIVWGRDDPIAPPRTGQVLAGRLAHSRLLSFDRVGHTPMLEAPEAFRDAVEPFARDGRWPKAARASPAPPPASAAAANAECRGESRRTYEGHFDQLVLENCSGARVRNSRVRRLRVVNSSVQIENSHIGGSEGGLSVSSGTVEMTGGRLAAEVAISAEYAQLDLAGVDIVASEAVARALAPSSIVFSLCRIDSPAGSRAAHRYVSVTPAHPLR